MDHKKTFAIDVLFLQSVASDLVVEGRDYQLNNRKGGEQRVSFWLLADFIHEST